MPADDSIRVGIHDRSAHLWGTVMGVAPCAGGQMAMGSPVSQAVMAFKQILHVPQRWLAAATHQPLSRQLSSNTRSFLASAFLPFEPSYT